MPAPTIREEKEGQVGEVVAHLQARREAVECLDEGAEVEAHGDLERLYRAAND